MKRSIVVNLQVEGVHSWPGCDIQEVDYLKHPHRHVFHIRCVRRVKGDDREVEIIMFKREVVTWMYKTYGRCQKTCIDFSGQSCEMIAETLANQFELATCEVLEDGENGAIVVREELL